MSAPMFGVRTRRTRPDDAGCHLSRGAEVCSVFFSTDVVNCVPSDRV